MSASTVGFRRGSNAHRRATQNGFSLVEVLIGIAIAALLSGLVATAFFVTGRSASSSSDSLVSSNSAFRTSARFADDVAGVGPVSTVSPDDSVTSGFATSGEPGCGGSPAVVRLVGPGSPASTVQVRSYEVAGTPDSPTLVRSECAGATLAAALASAATSTTVVPNLAATGGATASCNGEAFSGAECDSVALSILTASGFSYTLEASVRASRTPTVVTLPTPSPFKRTYADNPGSGTFSVEVPAYKTVTFELWGASGAGGENGIGGGGGGSSQAGNGGSSTYVTGTIAARETTYTLYVALGEGGRRGANGTGGDGGRSNYGSGGKGGARGSDKGGNGGGGGGASAISDNSTYNTGSILIVANGGGGGGGGRGSSTNVRQGGHGQGAIGADPATRGEISTSAASATLGIKGLNGTGSGGAGGNPGGAISPGLATPCVSNCWPPGAAGSGSNGGAGGNALDDSGGGGGGGGGRWGAGGGEGARLCCARGNHGGGGGGGGSAVAVGALAPWADWGLSGGVGGTANSGDRRGDEGKDGKVELRFS